MNCPHCGKPVTIALVGAGAQQAQAPATGDLGQCPVHNRPWEHKQGVSQRTGKPYSFWGCPVRDESGFCQMRPVKAWQPPAQQPMAQADLEELV